MSRRRRSRAVGVLALLVALAASPGPAAAGAAETAPRPGGARAPEAATPPAHPPQGAGTSFQGPLPTALAPVHFQVGRNNVKALMAETASVWIGTSGGLIHYMPHGDRYRKYDNTTGLLSNGVFALARIRDRIWVGTYGGGLSVLDPASEQWRNYNIPDGMADAFVYGLLESASGDVWIATWSGANRVLGGEMDKVENWLVYTVENTGGGLPNDWVYGLAEGPSGEIWLATEGGLARFADGAWRHWTHADGLGAPYELVSADLPFRSDPGEVSSHHARQKQEQGLQDVKVAYNPNYVVSLAVDRLGQVWAGTWGAGLSRFDGATWRTFTVADGLPGNHVFALRTDARGELWIGTSQGLARYDGERFHRFGRADGLYSEVVFSMSFPPVGGTWIGGLGGVTWYPQGLDGRGDGG